MTATVLDMLKKYPTEFNLEEIPDTIKEITVADSIDIIQKPTHKQTGEGHEYTYKINEKNDENKTVIIDNYLGHYTVNFPYDPTGKERGGFFIDESGMIQSYS